LAFLFQSPGEGKVGDAQRLQDVVFDHLPKVRLNPFLSLHELVLSQRIR
jgi:hypothetical protein